MTKRIIEVLNIILALFLIAMVIAYASIIIPISLAMGVGFVLCLWLYAHLVDSSFMLWRWLKRKIKRE